jgi:hypothetical protein
MHKSGGGDDDDDDDDYYDDNKDKYDLQRSRTRNRYPHVRYFQSPHLPYIKISLQKKTLSQRLNNYILWKRFNLDQN